MKVEKADKGNYVVYMSLSCEWDYKAHEDIKQIGMIQLSTKPIGVNTGDDWDDVPSCSNSGMAYEGRIIHIDRNTKLYTEEDIKELHFLLCEREKINKKLLATLEMYKKGFLGSSWDKGKRDTDRWE